VFIEFPAGKLDPGESPLASAQRELIEETGYRADAFVALGRVHSLVSYSTEVIDFYEARGLSYVGAKLDHGEFLEIVEMTPQAMLAALDRGEITDAKTVAALLLFVRRHRDSR
jgi:ADP-ribose diphosphatase